MLSEGADGVSSSHVPILCRQLFSIPPVIATPSRPPAIKFLKTPTSQAWIDQALANLDEVMLDHSHCERKAAGIAIKLMFLYPGDLALVEALTDIAQEELSHFKQVNQWLERRGVALRSLAAGPYGAKLRKDRKSTRLNSSHPSRSRMPSSA